MKKWSIWGLFDLNEDYSCQNLWKKRNYTHYIMIVMFLSIFLLSYVEIFILLNILSFSYFFYKFVLSIFGLFANNKGIITERIDLPKYCILLPVRNEKVYIIEELIQNINNLNYPKHKLDVVLLIDEDDDYLEDVKRDIKIPNHFRIVSAVPEFPLTKPKVCNLGLETTDAEYVTIYDVEDKPHPNQLLEVIYQFDRYGVDCVQCALHYENDENNWLTSFFTNEYLTWFNLTIRGLDMVQGDVKVIPLGGTSQHLKVDQLKSIGGWDSFNVTEDCDLGVRMARLGLYIKTIASRTTEKAVDELSVWIKQRTRWQMGFIVTFFTHSKNTLQTIKDLGIVGYIHFILAILGNVVAPLLTPILVIIWIDSLFFHEMQRNFLNTLQWVTLIGNYFLIVISHAIASIKYNKGKFLIHTIFQPFYYILQSITVYRAIYKFITAPFVWEKTPHK